MAPASKADKKAARDAASWMFNVVTSVGIIIINKALKATYGFSYATTFNWPTLCHYNVDDVYSQIAKLSIIPDILYRAFWKSSWTRSDIQESRNTKLSITLVLMGVAVCTVTDVSVNTKGCVAAVLAVWSTALHHMFIFFRGTTLLVLSIYDNKRVDNYDYNVTSVSLLILPCTIVIGTNLSLFICIGRFTAVSFQVLGHRKTILVLILGVGILFLQKEVLSIQVVIGIIIGVIGIWKGLI